MNIYKDQVKTLVLLYQQHPCLYVTKSANYHNRNKREKALEIICERYKNITQQSLTPEIVKQIINHLYSQYLSNKVSILLNKMKQLKANGVCSHDVYKPSWWLFEEMSFLDPYIAQRKGESSLTISKTQSKDTESVKMYDEDNDDLEFLDNKNNRQAKENVCRNIQPNASCSSPTRPRSATPSNRKKVNCFVDSLDELLTCDIEDYWKNAINVVKSMGMTEEMEDELKHWILYIEGKLRNNPHLNNLAAVQRKIIQLFHFNNFLIFINNACPYKQFIYLLNI